MPLLAANFAPLDWIVVGGYVVLLVVTGIYFARRKQRGTDDYFLAGHSMPGWAVAISLLATAQSAATFVGAPEQSYQGNLIYLSTNIGTVIGAFILAFFFVPAYYRAKAATPYGLLESRFGPSSVRATSLAYIIGRVLASGSRIYIAAIPAALILFGYAPKGGIPDGQLLVAIWALTIIGIAYTLVGGIRSVIWTDVIQAFVYVGAAIAAIIVLLNFIPVSLPKILSALTWAGPDCENKLALIDTGLDPEAPLGISFSRSMTLPAILTGFVLMTVASYGTDNDLTQRLLTCKDKKTCVRTVFGGLFVGIPVVAIFLFLGLLLYVYYAMPELMGDDAPTGPSAPGRKVFTGFILNEMPVGLKGLMMAGLFAAGLSTVNSTLNAMSSAFINDIYKPAIAPGRDDRHYLRAGRIGVVTAGLVLATFASICVPWNRAENSTLIDFALGVMAFAYAGLLGVFFTALFTKRGTPWSVSAALIVGFLVVFLMRPNLWDFWKIAPDWLANPGIAYPWQLLVGTIVAFIVCAAPKGRTPAESEEQTEGS